eukprot:gene32116-16633_t
MGCCGEFLLKIFKFLIKLIEVGCAIAIIIIIAIHLQDVKVTPGGENILTDGFPEYKFTCALGNLNDQFFGTSATNYCAYAYSVAGISLAASLVMSILLCLTCDLCGCGLVFELILALCLALWWMAAGIVFAVSKANDWGQSWEDVSNAFDNLFSWEMTQDNWRTSIPILAWIACVCFFLTFLICVTQLACGCCGRSGGADAKEAKKAAKEAKESQKSAEKAQKALEKANKEAGVVEVKSTAAAMPL